MQEESKNKKPKWGKPKLIILTRGKPEERVLTSCKLGYGIEYRGYPSTSVHSCHRSWPFCGSHCSQLVGS